MKLFYVSIAFLPLCFLFPSYSNGDISKPAKLISINARYARTWYGMIWYGMVWYGMVWYGMVWYGMVWYGMVWYGTHRL